MKPRVTILLTLASALCCYEISAQTPLDSLKSAFEDQIGQTTDEFRQYSQQAIDEYNEYTRQAAKDYEQYLEAIADIWGQEGIMDNTPTEWVEYGDDFKSRSIVDFDNGMITVEVMLADDGASEEELLAQAISRLLASRGSTCPYQSTVDVSEPLTQKPILDGLVDFSGYDLTQAHDTERKAPAAESEGPKAPPAPTVRGERLPEREGTRPPKPATPAREEKEDRPTMADRILGSETKTETDIKSPADREAVAKAVAEQSVKSYKTYTDGTDARRAVAVTLSLVTDNLSKNAALYKDIIAEFSEKFQIEQALIFAVMEQESRFNPEAQSWVPAYGLMQLVPKSGGFDAYRYVYGKEWVPTKSYLFNPRNNIELGTAYLRILENQFSDIEDPHCRRLCVIAGYNTGAGNVSRAFTGNTNLRKALPLINQYGYKRLYDHLTTKLSTEEARNYVSGVSQRREKYLK